MTADIRTAALAEARGADLHHELSSAHYTRVFTAGAVWAAARVAPTREQIATEIAKHFRIGDEVDGGYYCGCGEGDYRDANHVADAILTLMAGLAEGESDE